MRSFLYYLYARLLLGQVRDRAVPRHLGIILDGNRRFAIARGVPDLREAYALAGPQIKQGQTMKEWMTGNIAVVPYPVDSIDYAPMKIDYSYANEALIEVALLPTDKAQKQGVRSQLFMAGLKKINGKWVVNEWTPRSSPPVPNGSGNNGG